MADNRSWQLPRQHNLLSSHLGKFLEHQAANTLKVIFWPRLHRKFFRIWKSQDRELREWRVLKEMVEGGKAPLPSCLGGSNDPEAKKSGLDIKVPEKEDGEDESDDDDDDAEKDDGLSELSSDDENVRAANESAAAKIASGGAPEGASNGGPARKSKKKKKPAKITIPERFKDKKAWKTKRTEQIQRWFYNATAKSRTSVPKVNIDFKNLFTSALGGRTLTEPQMYAKMYYESRVKEDVDNEVAERGLNKGQRIALTAKRLQESYAAETDEVKEKVREELAKVAKEKEEAMDLLKKMVESGGEKEQTPEEYARIQGSLKPILRCFFDMLGPMAGYAFLVVGGGPKSSNPNGTMGYVSYNRGWGEMRDEFTFNRWYDGYQEKVVKPFGKYCHEVFPEDVRLQRAINIVESDNLNFEALKKSGRNLGKLQSGGELPKHIANSTTPAAIPTQPGPNHSARKGQLDGTARLSIKPNGAQRKGKKKAVSSSEDEGADGEQTEDPSDPSDHEVRGKRKEAGRGVKGRGTTKGDKGRKEVAPWSDSDVDDDAGETEDAVTRPKRAIDGTNKKVTESRKGGDEENGGESDVEPITTKKHGGKSKVVKESSPKEKKGDKPKAKKGRKGRGGRRQKGDKAVAEVEEGADDEAEDVVEGAGNVPRTPEGTKPRTRAGKARPVPDNGAELMGEDQVDGDRLGAAEKVSELSEGREDIDAPPQGPPLSFPESPYRYRLPTPPHLSETETTKKRKPDSSMVGGERSKRARRTTREPEQWVVETKSFLLECGSGKVWEGLVDAWFEFETKGFDKQSRVTEVNSRPQELKRWLAARKSSMPCALVPLLDDEQGYKAQWMMWWDDLKGDGEAGQDTAVKNIRRAGPSGVVTILLGLAFWSTGKARNAEWKRVVGELQAYLKHD